MTFLNDKISEANKSYVMDAAKRKCISANSDTFPRQSSVDRGAFDPEGWKTDKISRLREIHRRRREYLDKGAGTFDVLNDEKEIINAANNNTRMVCHFYEEGFERCKILDSLLTSLSSRFLDTKFVKIMATKAPFFTHKIGLKVLPTLLATIDGNITKIYLGFQEFGGDKINLKTLRNTLLRHNILTDECCIVDADSDDDSFDNPDI